MQSTVLSVNIHATLLFCCRFSSLSLYVYSPKPWLPISLDIFRSGRSHLGLFLTFFLSVCLFLLFFSRVSFLALACAFYSDPTPPTSFAALIIINTNDASISSLADRTHTAHCTTRVIELIIAKVHNNYLFTVP